MSRVEILPTYLIRLSGFSFRRLEEFRFARTLERLAELSRAASALGAAANVLERDRAAAPHLRNDARRIAVLTGSLSALPEKVAKSLDESFPDLALTYRESRRRFEEDFDADLDAARTRLRAEFAADPRLREAVFLESPTAYGALDRLDAGPRRSKSKQREATAIMYLQRFCAKNDTNSMCGPIGISHFSDAPASGRLALENELARRKVYLSHWAARALSRDEESVRLNPASRYADGMFEFCRMEHDATTFFKRSYRRVSLDRGALEDPDAQEELVDAGILLSGTLPVGLFDPLPDPPAAIRAGLQSFASGDLATREGALSRLETDFEELTAHAARRGAGMHYADRGLLHEDVFAEVDADLGKETTQPLLSALEVVTRVAVLPMDRVRADVLAWFRDQFGEGRFVSALEAHQAFDRDRPHQTERTTAPIEAVRVAIAAAIERGGGGPAQLDPEELLAARPAALRPGFGSADVMLLPETEAARFVLGEMHGFFLLPTFWFDVAPEEIRARALEEMRGALDRLRGGRPTAEALFSHTQATDRRFPLADFDLEVIGKSSRSGAIRFGDLQVGIADERIQFRWGGEEILPLTVYSGYPFFSYLSPLAPLVDESRGKFFPAELLPDGARDRDAPRLQIGNVIFRRAAWTRRTEEIRLDDARSCDLFSSAQRLRESLGCARFVFVSIAGEPKPILLDFENLLLIEVFAKRLRRQQRRDQVRFSEMLPAPEHLLLEGPDGPRTFELRIGVYQPA